MKKLLLVTLSALLGATSAFGADQARSIMDKADARDDGDSMVSTMQMTLIDKNNKQRTRQMRTFSKDIDANTEHKTIFFLSPSDVKNTAFLTYDYSGDDKDDDQWMYLPALKKTKRIPASDKDAAFMGSDFSYSDMTDKELDDYSYKLLGESTIKRAKGDEQVWKIEALPANQGVIDETGYTKSILYVRKDNYVLTRAKFYLKKASRIKYMDVKEIQKIDGIWVAMKTTMTTKQGKQTLHKTILTNSDVRINQPIDSNMFTIRTIEKGL
ncbi:outer membrane lipoprotein-sorting protein [Candidatus Thioglobus sp.]|nr:outer membrane lipoprotein-sorting protein [Candidatus Thioglobus sp.]MDB3893203.1 outer membrane lipoprotein-sorting protein [Candidatus Thioglobus sp.]MDB9828958.1 outer membrane lipoprotein-sorting protein [Candidatus Thioglobus sp.]MDC0888471.1 outer membrane lipoprotein-sorting protein [Candidatus Thioglobus sp.]MDC0904627.1 outer membrane lipoprotein-sorting protein [Candidatus Thioglobus sp.]